MRLPRLHRDHWPKVVAGIVALPAVIIASLLHAFFLRAPNAVGFDDGYTVAAAERLISGHWLPYVDACSHRGPMLYWIVALAQKLSGRFNWAGPRWLMFLTCLTTIGGLVGVGFAGRMPLAGALAALAFIYMSIVTGEPESGFAVTGEAIAASFGILALLFCTLALMRAEKPRTRLALLAACGACAALAGMTKQTAFLLVVPLGVWTLASACALEGVRLRQRFAPVIALTAGFFAPILIIVLRYALAGELRTFWYWFYTYNVRVYMAPYAGHAIGVELNQFFRDWPWTMLLIVVLCILGARPAAEITSPRSIPKAIASHGLEVTTSLLLLAAFIGFTSPRRFWAPYHHLYFPFLAIALGVRIGLLLESGKGNWIGRLASQILVGGFFVWWVCYVANLRIGDFDKIVAAGGRYPALPEPMCDFFQKYSGPNDSIFIWGFDGDLYVTCHRRPATRFTYLTLVAGTVPPAWTEPHPEWIARDARKNLMQDMEKNQPKVVLDMPYNMHNVSLTVMPELVAYLDKNYCQVPPVSTKNGRRASAWVIRGSAGCP